MGTRQNRLAKAVLTSTQIYVLCRNMKNIRVFLSENFQILEVKLSIYLNRRVFVMMCLQSQGQHNESDDFHSCERNTGL